MDKKIMFVKGGYINNFLSNKTNYTNIATTLCARDYKGISNQNSNIVIDIFKINGAEFEKWKAK